MKKIIATLLIALLSLSLAACGAAEPAPAKEEAPQQAAEPEKAPEAGQTGAEAPAAEPEAPAEEAPAGEPEAVEELLSTEEKIARVIDMQGQPVEELIDWLGEPISRDYASSCNIEGGQDGQLDYGDFTVFTTVWPDGSETVEYCE